MNEDSWREPAGVSVMDAKIARVVERLRERGVRLPVGRGEVSGMAGAAVIREMARRGLIRHGELYDGTLPQVVAQSLEGVGITSREEFRRKYWAGEVRPHLLRNVGLRRTRQLLAWADVPVSPEDVLPSPLELTRETCRAIDELAQRRGLGSRTELITQLVLEESKRLKVEVGRRERSGVEEKEPAPRDAG